MLDVVCFYVCYWKHGAFSKVCSAPAAPGKDCLAFGCSALIVPCQVQNNKKWTTSFKGYVSMSFLQGVFVSRRGGPCAWLRIGKQLGLPSSTMPNQSSGVKICQDDVWIDPCQMNSNASTNRTASLNNIKSVAMAMFELHLGLHQVRASKGSSRSSVSICSAHLCTPLCGFAMLCLSSPLRNNPKWRALCG